MICLEKTIDEYVESGILEHIAVRVGQGNHVIYDTYRGGVDETTLFDMASVTKIMVTTSLALIALDNGLLKLEDKVHQFYSTSKSFTIKNLLTHTIGIGHCGHTGQSVFVDYRSGLYVIILSDATISTVKKYGKEHYNEVMDMRARLHSAIKCDLRELSF